MIIPRPPSIMTLEEIWLSIIILSCIVGLETAILLGIRLSLGSFRRLLALAITSNSHKKPTNKKNISDNHIEDDSHLTQK